MQQEFFMSRGVGGKFHACYESGKGSDVRLVTFCGVRVKNPTFRRPPSDYCTCNECRAKIARHVEAGDNDS